MNLKFHTIPEIIEDIKNGKIVIILDDPDRENEGDFVMAAQKVTPEAINFMALYGRGLICTPIDRSIALKLKLTPMVPENTALHQTAFTVSIDAKEGISTGISATDRSHSISLMLKEDTSPEDFSRPGHIFPLIAHEGGVLERAGHTEAACDLAELAGFSRAGVICEILKEDGEQARGLELFEVARRFNLKIGTIADLKSYLNLKTLEDKQEFALNFNLNECEEISRIDFPNKFGHFKLSLFKSSLFPAEEHVALHMGLLDNDSINESNPSEVILARLHSECFTGDVFGSKRCDCGEQLSLSLSQIADRKKGILIYLKQEGRGIGLAEKMKSYVLQESGVDTVDANLKLGHPVDKRSYDFAGLILNYFKIKNIELLTNNPEKIMAMRKLGIKVERNSLLIAPNRYNEKYLMTKIERMGHLH